MTNIKYIWLRLTILCILLIPLGRLFGQNIERVEPLKETTLKPLQIECFVFASGSTKEQRSLCAGANNYKHMFMTQAVVGLGTELFFDNKKPNESMFADSRLRLGLNLGYDYKRYGYKRSFLPTSGVISHWLNLDVNCSYSMVNIGVKSDFLLGSKTVNTASETYNGLNNHCFNKATFAYYGGIVVKFTNISARINMGGYIVPDLNVDKIAYYNMDKTDYSTFFGEVVLSYRIFTTIKY